MNTVISKKTKKLLLGLSIFIIYISILSTVLAATGKITLNKETMTIYKGLKSKSLYAKENTTNEYMYWKSSNPSIVKVICAEAKIIKPKVTIEGIKEGEAIVTAYTADGKIKDSCKVIVKKENTVTTSSTSNNKSNSIIGSIINTLFNIISSVINTKVEKSEDEPINTSSVIVNEESKTGYRFYYLQLSSASKSIYNYLLKNEEKIKKNETIIINQYGSFEEILLAMNALQFDYPEFYMYTTNKSSYYISKNLFTYKIIFNKRNSSLEDMMNKIEKISNTIVEDVKGKNDYEKVKYINDWICNNMKYELNESLDIYGVVEKKGQCQTYAFIFKYLMNKIDIDCIYVNGTLQNGQGHSWNHIKLNNKWYGIDVTWNDNLSSKEYFLKGTSTFGSRTLNPKLYNKLSVSYPSLSLKNY